MAQETNNKYHFTKDGRIFRINPDSTLTEVYITERKPDESTQAYLYSENFSSGDGIPSYGDNSTATPKSAKLWIRQNFLFVLSLCFILIYCIAAISCSSWGETYYNSYGEEYYRDNFSDVCCVSILIISAVLVIGLFTISLFDNKPLRLWLNTSLILTLGTFIYLFTMESKFIEYQYSFQVMVPAILSCITLLIYVINKNRRNGTN